MPGQCGGTTCTLTAFHTSVWRARADAQVDDLWDVAASRLKAVMTKQMQFCTNVATMKEIKRRLLCFLYTMEVGVQRRPVCGLGYAYVINPYHLGDRKRRTALWIPDNQDRGDLDGHGEPVHCCELHRDRQRVFKGWWLCSAPPARCPVAVLTSHVLGRACNILKKIMSTDIYEGVQLDTAAALDQLQQTVPIAHLRLQPAE